MADQSAGHGRPSTSGMAIAGLVVAIIAAITSIVPIVNNASFFIAIVSLVLAIVGMVGISRGKHSGKGIAIAGIVLSVLAIVLVLASQSLYSSALNSAIDGPQASSSSSSQSTGDSSGAGSSATSNTQQAADYSNMSVGDSVTLDNGLTVSVDNVKTGIKDYDGSELVAVTVSYVNNGTSNASFNAYDWKAEDSNGAQRDQTYFSENNDELGSGELSAGGSVTGAVYFDAPISKVHYYSSALSDSSTAAWLAS